MVHHPIELPEGAQILEVNAYECDTEQEAIELQQIFESIGPDMPVVLPNGQQQKPLTNGQVFVFKRVNKLLIIVLVMLVIL